MRSSIALACIRLQGKSAGALTITKMVDGERDSREVHGLSDAVHLGNDEPDIIQDAGRGCTDMSYYSRKHVTPEGRGN